ncbi:hypothetical protein MSAN_01945600 [Mycena sanguinolenta]|uniref:Uncharacterized protein n=1 Tax=Mycena sanguinolenta TaxID=230812 RepID=A0A8H6XQF3_9AGAR|nr:hypothetical protein MSAN_01945600 [Mycena sanguinolenta]
MLIAALCFRPPPCWNPSFLIGLIPITFPLMTRSNPLEWIYSLVLKSFAQIDERIRELSVQRDQIQAYIDSHKALISHPRRLPVDIVQEDIRSHGGRLRFSPRGCGRLCTSLSITSFISIKEKEECRPSSSGYSALRPIPFRYQSTSQNSTTIRAKRRTWPPSGT